MKKLLLLIFAVVTVLGASAQPNKVLGQNQAYMGPYTSDDYATNGIGVTGLPGTYDIMVELPSTDIAVYDGGKIVGMRFAMAQKANTTRCFVQGVKGDEVVTLVEGKVETSQVGWNEVAFEEPLAIDLSEYDALMLGFDYKQTSSNYPISYGPADVYYRHYFYGNLGNGIDYYEMDLSAFGNLSVQAIVEKDGGYPQNSVNVVGMDDLFVGLGHTGTGKLWLQNVSGNGVSDFDYTVTKDGVSSDEIHYALNKTNTTFNGRFPVDVELAADEEVGTKELTITVTKVNGEVNGSTANSAVVKLITVEKLFEKRVAVEEFTGTGCGWCPRGLQAMENMREAFGDKFVGIGIHQYSAQSSDAMYIAPKSYANLNFSGAPQCRLNRGNTMDPYYGSKNTGIFYDFQSELDGIAEVGVEIEASWVDATKQQVAAKATVESIVDGNTYNIEYVLIADGLTGSGTGWNQSNYYYQYTAAQVEDDLRKFAAGGEMGQKTIKGYVFNDVAIASSYVNSKNTATALGTLTSYTPVENEFTLTMPTYAKLLTAIQDSGYDVYAIALVINKATGRIVNCAKVKVAETAGIQNVVSAESNGAIYNLSGQKVDSMQKGIYIVNGKKYMVK